MMGTCQLTYFKCVLLRNVGKVITSWLIKDITPFSQFDLAIHANNWYISLDNPLIHRPSL